MSESIRHHSQLSAYRMPQGAQPCGASVTLRLAAPESARCTLRLWLDGQEKRQPMSYRGWIEGEQRHEAALVLPQTPCVLWYSFIVEMEGKTFWYGNAPDGLGGEGRADGCQPPSFQITVYDPNFHVPEWMADGVMYQIFVDRFCDGGRSLLSRRQDIKAHASWRELPDVISQPASWENYPYDFFGGNLLGVESKLPYLKSLGVSVLYLNPIFEAKSNHKYDTADYTRVDPTFGGNTDFERLCRKARNLGIRILLDGVFSHTGEDSRYFNRYGHYDTVGACQSKDSPYAKWYRFSHYPDQYACWWGVSTLPEVNEKEPSYRQFIISDRDAIVARWIRAGASGWRLDVADELPDDFIKALRERVKRENPEAAVLGEVWEDATNKVSYGKLREYALGHSLDSVMNYPLRDALLGFFTGREDAFRFCRRVNSLKENYPPQMFYALMNLMGSHDRARVLNLLSGCTGEGLEPQRARELKLTPAQYTLGKRRLKAMFALLCALPGMPCIYYGDEAGMQGAADPFCRGPYPWGHEDVDLVEYFRGVVARRNADPIWRRGTLTLLAPNADTLLVLREIQGGVDALGKPAKDGCALFAVSRSAYPVWVELNTPKLAPFKPYWESLQLRDMEPLVLRV